MTNQKTRERETHLNQKLQQLGELYIDHQLPASVHVHVCIWNDKLIVIQGCSIFAKELLGKGEWPLIVAQECDSELSNAAPLGGALRLPLFDRPLHLRDHFHMPLGLALVPHVRDGEAVLVEEVARGDLIDVELLCAEKQ